MAFIEHVALWAEDLELVCGFYEKYFDASIGELYHNPAKGFRSRFLRFGQGARLEVMSTTTLSLVPVEPGAQVRGLTHLALSVGSEAAVDALTARLRADGFPVIDGPRRTGDGYYESVILDPEGNRIEVTV